MKKFFYSAALLALALGSQTFASAAESRPSRPGTPQRTERPGKSDGKFSSNGNHRSERPGQSVSKPSKPSHSGSNGFTKPNKPSTPSHKPSTPVNKPSVPQHKPSKPVYRPGHSRPSYLRPSVRPGRPVYSWHRPTPPGHWRPTYGNHLLGNILGVTFGTILGNALDHLYHYGYNVDGYMNNEIYLTGVTQFNLYWPDATMYFSPSGLTRTQFYYPTSYYDTGRFYTIYDMLCRQYGMPAMQKLSGNMSATWFGAYGDFITLELNNISSGNYRYFTILTIGR